MNVEQKLSCSLDDLIKREHKPQNGASGRKGQRNRSQPQSRKPGGQTKKQRLGRAAQFNGKRLPKSFPVLTSERDPAAVAVPRSGVRRDQRRKGKSSQTQLYTGRQFNAQAPGVLSGAEMKTATIKGLRPQKKRLPKVQALRTKIRSRGFDFSGPVPVTSLNRRREQMQPILIATKPRKALLRQRPQALSRVFPEPVVNENVSWAFNRRSSKAGIAKSAVFRSGRTELPIKNSDESPSISNFNEARNGGSQQIRIVTELSHIPEPLLAQQTRDATRVLNHTLSVAPVSKLGPTTLSDRFS